MCKLEVDVDSYVAEIRHEHLHLDMMEDPEVNPDLPADERKIKADDWFKARQDQLALNETEALTLVKHAYSCNFLTSIGFCRANDKIRRLYDELRAQSQKRYQEAVEEVNRNS